MSEASSASPASAPADSRTPRPRQGPLTGIRVADFCWMGVGALATRLLADMGAEVIKIEDGRPKGARLDITRRLPIYKGEPALPVGVEKPNLDPNASGMFNNYNRNKLGVAIDMRKPRGRELAERLIAASDVVTENFAPGVMERWGLAYDRIRALSPPAIFCRMSGFGHSGPYESFRSYGPVVQAVSGLSHISGLPGREPSGWGMSYMDNQAAYYNSNAILTAIYNRNITGEGCEIDVSAVEAGIGLIGPLMLDVSVNGRATRCDDFPMGNRLAYQNAAPHGVYPAAGDDNWIAIAVFDDDEWKALVNVLGDPAWAADSRFRTQADRYDTQDALDEHLSAWTRGRDRHEMMRGLQAAGVRAAALQSMEDIVDHDPQVAHRGLYFEMNHPVVGLGKFEGVPIHFSHTVADNMRSGPLLGEDNSYVLKTILGVSDDDYDALRAAEVI